MSKGSKETAIVEARRAQIGYERAVDATREARRSGAAAPVSGKSCAANCQL